MKHLLVPFLALAVVVLVSGCTSFCIPGFPCGEVISQESNVIVIKSFEAIPSEVSANQQVRLILYIQNQGDYTIPQTIDGDKIGGEIEVELFDYCKGLFELEGSNPSTKIGQLLPQETQEIDWVLKPTNIKLVSQCDFKVLVRYPYKTSSLTSITFINSDEYKQQLERGTFSSISSFITKGQGPVKVYFDIKDQQPIPTSENENSETLAILTADNEGKGFISDNKIVKDKIKIDKSDDGLLVKPNIEDIKLIKGTSASKTFMIKVPKKDDVDKLVTKKLIVEAEYIYELRETARVKVNPTPS